MADPFGDQGKRPAPTIEGTATEIKPADEAPRETAAAEEPSAGRTSSDPETAGEEVEMQGAAAPQPGAIRTFALPLISGAVGGILAGLAVPYIWEKPLSEAEPDLSAFEARIAKLETAPVPVSDSGQAQRIARLEDSLKALAQAADKDGSVADAAALGQRIDEAEARFQAKLDEVLDREKTVDSGELDSLRMELTELKSRIASLREAATDQSASAGPEIMALSERLLALEATVPNLVGAIDKEMAGTRSAALTLAFSNLRTAVNAGKPYAGELKTITALAPATGDLGELPNFSDKGIPTTAELAQQFREKMEAVLAPTAAPADDSFLGEIMTSAQSLVKIRRVDNDPQGSTPNAVLARADNDLENNKLADAVAEVETLQGDARDPFASWLEAAKARLAAESTLQQLEGTLLATLAGGAQAQP